MEGKEKSMGNETMFSNIEKPLISVIVPVYNVEKYIHRCVESILLQTYTNIELILVDDGSPDRCGEICDEYAALDSRIKVIHQENQGVSKARNAGIDIAKGDYIAFVDSDDYIVENMYEIMFNNLIKNKADICVCQWQYECIDGKHVVDLANVDEKIFGRKTAREFAEYLYRGKYENGVACAAWNKLYKRDVFYKIRFEGKYVEDDRIHNKILSKGYSVIIIPEQLYIYCQNNESLTNKPFRDDNLLFLDVLLERILFFSGNEFILENTRKLYCNMYIEYYYKAQSSNIKMRRIDDFDSIVRSLVVNGEADLKFIIRMLLFRIAPKIYRKVCWYEN